MQQRQCEVQCKGHIIRLLWEGVGFCNEIKFPTCICLQTPQSKRNNTHALLHVCRVALGGGGG